MFLNIAPTKKCYLDWSFTARHNCFPQHPAQTLFARASERFLSTHSQFWRTSPRHQFLLSSVVCQPELDFPSKQSPSSEPEGKRIHLCMSNKSRFRRRDKLLSMKFRLPGTTQADEQIKKKNQTRHQTRLLCLEGDSPALTFNAHIIVFSDGNNCKNAYKARNFWWRSCIRSLLSCTAEPCLAKMLPMLPYYWGSLIKCCINDSWSIEFSRPWHIEKGLLWREDGISWWFMKPKEISVKSEYLPDHSTRMSETLKFTW